MPLKVIINQIFQYLKQPAVADFSIKDALFNALIIGIGVVLIVLFINRYNSYVSLYQSFYYSICFGLITFCISFLNDFLLPRLFPEYFKEDNWIVGKSIVLTAWNYICIATANFLFVYYLGWANMNIADFGSMFLTTLCVGVVPLVMLSLWQHNKRLKQRLSEIVVLQNKLQQQDASLPKASNQYITIPSNQQEVKLLVDTFIFAISERNYVRLILEDDQLTIRNTIKNMEDLLSPFPYIIRCHRAYIVNTKKVINISGNAQGYRLQMSGSETIVPVSRSYITKVKELFN